MDLQGQVKFTCS